MPVSAAASAAFWRMRSSYAEGRTFPRVHHDVTRIARNPASRASSILATADGRSACFGASSAAPTTIPGPPQAAGTSTRAAAAPASVAMSPERVRRAEWGVLGGATFAASHGNRGDGGRQPNPSVRVGSYRAGGGGARSAKTGLDRSTGGAGLTAAAAETRKRER